MNERQIFSKILRLDKYIYNELLVLNGVLQKGIAIYLAVATLTTLSAFRLFNGLIEFLESNLVLFSSEMSEEEFEMFKVLIDELSRIFIQQDSTTTLLTSSIVSTTVTTLVSLVICFSSFYSEKNRDQLTCLSFHSFRAFPVYLYSQFYLFRIPYFRYW